MIANVEKQLREVELLEAETPAREDGRHIAEVTLIRSGTSRNGNHYPPEVLSGAVPLFEGALAFADHSRPGELHERSVRDIVGYYRNVAHLQEAAGSRLRAELHLLPGNGWLWTLLQESRRNPAICGLSIDAFGETERARDGTTQVRALRRVQSVDIVTRPSAGGSFDRLIQSDRGTGKDSSPMAIDTPPTPTPAQPNDTLLAELREQSRRQQEELDSLKRLREQEIEQARRLAESGAHLTTKLAEAALPEPVARKIRKQFSDHPFELAHLEEAIADEKETLAALSAAGNITGMGAPKLELGFSEYEQVQAAFDGLFEVQESERARSVPRLSGIREAFAIATGLDIAVVGGADRPLKESLQGQVRDYVASKRLTESETLLREADVTTASFSYLLGTSMNKKFPTQYQSGEHAG